ncbi:glycosyltransferase [Hymenobacter sp. BT186]|uniref:Glycosyltransferase n=1 Tax=Hymenobacter telluris TaxID=2816474 RepID=A0A939EV14_9BACT|nr:glycosyltransferase [Hymenobacter telluris]MBO0357501.1 glycosyltransferase [Hymenobacter telluris]MBW3373527.1 glycosyltransferase [Hymenobacter norwichensis]
MPKMISIATPTFGKPKYLRECVTSVHQQSIKTQHIICGGNFSSEELESNRVQVILRNPDPGMVTCWNTAADCINTEYIGFLADDNTLTPNYSETLISFLENNPECDLVFCNQYHMDENGLIDKDKSFAFTKHFGRDKLSSGIIQNHEYNFLLENNSIPLEACIIRKKIWKSFGPFNINAKGAFDQEFIYRLILGKVKIGFLPEYLMNFRWHNDAYCSVNKLDHSIGSSWVNQSLMHESIEHYSFFRNRSFDDKLRILKMDPSIKNKTSLALSLLKENGSIKYLASRFINFAVK